MSGAERWWWAAWAALAVWWALVLRHLNIEWQLNEHYSYGPLVPLLSAYLVWQGWERRGTAKPPQRNFGLAFLAALIVASYFPLRLVQESNPDWRLVSWASAIGAVVLTWIAIDAAGGRPWLREMAFPVAFILVAVPWPTVIEAPFVQGMTRVVAQATAEIAQWNGIPAVPRGNVIELPSGMVSVDEACSGVRSFQSLLMVALFMGEWHRLGWSRRLALVGIGLGTAFVGNLARAQFLVGLAARDRLSTAAAWHDAVGYGVLASSLVAVAAFAWCLRRPGLPVQGPPPAPRLPGRPIPGAAAVLALGWLAISEVSTEAWYRAHETAQAQPASWKVVWPEQAQTIELSPRERQLLRADDAQARTWRDGFSQWTAYFLRWQPGRNAAQLARLHRPEVCLPAAGAVLQQDHGWLEVDLGMGLAIPFRYQVFQGAGRPLYVFHCLWEDRPSGGANDDFSAASRWRSVVEGRRQHGQRVLELVVAGPSDAREAEHLARALIPRLMQPENQTPATEEPKTRIPRS
jgi:exosortase